MLRQLAGYSAVVSCCMALSNVHAHHSYSEYDDKKTIEIDGTLTKVALTNPHVHFFVRGVDQGGRSVTWDLESTSLNWLRRTQVPSELLKVGSRVKFAGWPSRRSAERMFGLNMLAADGQEILLFRTATLRWRNTALGYGTKAAQSYYEGGVANGSDTLFRVWASQLGAATSLLTPTAPLELTASAKQAVAAFDSVKYSTEMGCTPKGMPALMVQPPPMEFIEKGDKILMRTEEYDTVRTIHMRASANPEAIRATPLGYSVGRWDGRTLVVETSRLDSRYLIGAGVPLGANARMVERFTPSTDGSQLDYSLVVTAPDSLIKPAEFKRKWVYRPGEKVLPFNCKV